MYCKGKRVIMCWAMGITQHRHSVPTIQEIVNLMLLRGNIGKPGGNVQGDRTMGINERPPVALLDAIERRFNFPVPRSNGHNTVEAIHAMLEGRAKVFIGLGGNVHRPGRQLRPGDARHRAHRPGAAQLRTDRAHQHQAQPQPPDPRPAGADPAMPGAHRHRHARRRPTSGDGGRLVQHGSPVQRPVAPPVAADAFRACGDRRHRRRHAGQPSGGLELDGGRLRPHPRPDRRHHSRLHRFQPAPAPAGVVSTWATAPANGSGRPPPDAPTSGPTCCRTACSTSAYAPAANCRT